MTTNRIVIVVGGLLVLAFWSLAQNQSQAPSPSGPGFSPAKTVGLYVYPQKSQSSDQQLKDESACYGDAKQTTGVDPQHASQPTTAAQPRGHAVRGAAGGAAIGAIAGDAGKGAAIGAGTGAVVGRNRRRSAQAQADQENSQKTADLQQFKRAFTACMDARGYSVR